MGALTSVYLFKVGCQNKYFRYNHICMYFNLFIHCEKSGGVVSRFAPNLLNSYHPTPAGLLEIIVRPIG